MQDANNSTDGSAKDTAHHSQPLQHLPRKKAQFVAQLQSAEKWNLTSRKRSFEQLQLIFSNMPPNSTVKYIFLQWNHMPAILLPLSLCKLANLKALTLGGNNIQSVECFARGQFAHLEELWLWNNKITQIRALRKMNTPFLRIIDLSSNLLNENPSWSECNWSHLENVNLQKNQFGEINSMVKLQSGLLRLKINIINNKMASILQWRLREGRKIATYFFARHCTVIYC